MSHIAQLQEYENKKELKIIKSTNVRGREIVPLLAFLESLPANFYYPYLLFLFAFLNLSLPTPTFRIL